MFRRASGAVCLAAVACGPWQPVGGESPRDAAAVVPGLFEPAALYRAMGLLSAQEPLPFVASLRFLAGPAADSSLGVLAVSLTNRALSFRRAGSLFEAGYQVHVTLRAEGRLAQQFDSEETVRVTTFQETQRSDESVIFQRFVVLPPGSLAVVVAVRDRYSSRFNRAQGGVTVPAFDAGPRLSPPLPVYRAAGRQHRLALPDLVVNPRGAVPYGGDALEFYIEGYEIEQGAAVVVTLHAGREAPHVWRDTVALAGSAALTSAVVTVPSDALPVGRVRVEAVVAGRADTVSSLALVNFSDEWAVANFEQLVSLLRYFGAESARRALRDAPPADRVSAWKTFWEETDPDPATAEHEALVLYFGRLREANQRFGEFGQPGWLSDRGEVFITLGEPDNVVESTADFRDRGTRRIRWTYLTYRLTLDFVDETGLGRFRLTPASRAEYVMVLERIRRSD